MQSLFEPDAVKAVQKDYEYLQKMKEMDMEILLKEENQGEGGEEEERKGLEMTDVVPVGGLIMARYFLLGIITIFLFSFLLFLLLPFFLGSTCKK